MQPVPMSPEASTQAPRVPMNDKLDAICGVAGTNSRSVIVATPPGQSNGYTTLV
ncbi:hypothetical protein PGT21_023411 [Puccinia graminis f. sp. tritici]|uniref:Uncharacterized protein n=1 Tax=Puccinia graminis f. sp. tritici TaxID=56615 RepID=A0A5B0PGC4_PUCGR|nr:hypothetical protein PGT21_023411 [Puccinia graminis f. sp. tritici]KAA1123511.1 hypothetical protein PGTUg99_022876 [Puccinia graminis f. sp. tritici]